VGKRSFSEDFTELFVGFILSDNARSQFPRQTAEPLWEMYRVVDSAKTLNVKAS
jgi:hypothetical protein